MDEITSSMTRAEKSIWEKLVSIEKKLDNILEEKVFESIEEISLNKAARLLHSGADKIIRAVNNGRLKAITYWDSKHRKRYRFRIADIREFQKEHSTVLVSERLDVKSLDDLQEEHFGYRTKRRK